MKTLRNAVQTPLICQHFSSACIFGGICYLGKADTGNKDEDTPSVIEFRKHTKTRFLHD